MSLTIQSLPHPLTTTADGAYTVETIRALSVWADRIVSHYELPEAHLADWSTLRAAVRHMQLAPDLIKATAAANRLIAAYPDGWHLRDGASRQRAESLWIDSALDVTRTEQAAHLAIRYYRGRLTSGWTFRVTCGDAAFELSTQYGREDDPSAVPEEVIAECERRGWIIATSDKR